MELKIYSSMNYTEKLKQRIKSFVEENDILQRDIAKGIGMNPSSFSRRVQGKTSWKISEIEKLGQAYPALKINEN